VLQSNFDAVMTVSESLNWLPFWLSRPM